MSKCSKLIGIVVLGIVLVAGVSFAGIQEDLASANALYISNGYMGNSDAFAKIVKDYPNDPYLALAQLRYGEALRSEGKTDEALVAFQKVKDYSNPIADSSWLSAAQINIATYMMDKGEFTEAMDVINAISANNPALRPLELLNIRIAKSKVFKAWGKVVESNAILMPIAISEAGTDAVLPKHALSWVFKAIDPRALTAENYITFLRDVIKATPAIEANTEYLGRIKSELEKMK